MIFWIGLDLYTCVYVYEYLCVCVYVCICLPLLTVFSFSCRSRGQMPAKSVGRNDICGLCQDSIKPHRLAITACKHPYHRRCIRDYLAEFPKGEKPCCPVCFVVCTIDFRLNANGEVGKLGIIS